MQLLSIPRTLWGYMLIILVWIVHAVELYMSDYHFLRKKAKVSSKSKDIIIESHPQNIYSINFYGLRFLLNYKPLNSYATKIISYFKKLYKYMGNAIAVRIRKSFPLLRIAEKQVSSEIRNKNSLSTPWILGKNLPQRRCSDSQEEPPHCWLGMQADCQLTGQLIMLVWHYMQLTKERQQEDNQSDFFLHSLDVARTRDFYV